LLILAFAGTADAQITIGSPGANASIGPRRLFATQGELVWASFIGVHALDPSTGRTRSISHCGQVITDVALDDGWIYVLADRAQLCRMPMSGQSVQLLVGSPGAIIDGFAVSSAGVAYSQRRLGQQPILRVIQWNGQIRDHVCAASAEHVAIDATHVYWVDAGTLVRASIATGAKIAGPTIANAVRRLRVDRGNVYVATDHDVLRLDAASKSWTTLSVTGAEDLQADGASVYWVSRGVVTKLGVQTPLFTGHPYALALDARSLLPR
jgi:outer membrane protein assembly factor BamB